MLLPDYDELVDLKRQTGRAPLGAKTKSPPNLSGGHASLFKGRGLDFSEIREYAAGDDIRSIDWRVTARTGRAHTKLFTEERERSVFLIVDINSYMEFGTRQTFKSIQAARAAAHIAWRANELHDKLGAILFGHIPERVKFLKAKRSRRSIWEMLRILCTPNAGDWEVKIEEALVLANKCIPSGSSVFIISDFFNVSKEFEKQLGLLSKRGDITLVKVSDPADKNIPQADEIRFSSGGRGQVLVNTNDPSGGDHYRRLWAENQTALREMAYKFRSKMIDLSTDKEVSLELFRKLNPPSRRIRV